MFTCNHQDEVDNPKDKSKTNQTKNSGKNFTFHKSCNCSANPRSEGNDCQNDAYNVTKSKVITFSFCHSCFLLFFIAEYIILPESSECNIFYILSDFFDKSIYPANNCALKNAFFRNTTKRRNCPKFVLSKLFNLRRKKREAEKQLNCTSHAQLSQYCAHNNFF